MITNCRIIRVANVNGAFAWLMSEASTIEKEWLDISPRGLRTMEHRGPIVTEYTRPNERVLFHPIRDANPFFHFMESLWILNGQRDVATLSKYNSNISSFSDDGISFHAAYGYRLRHEFRMDQILHVVALLKKDPSTRRAVMAIWNPELDLGANSKDLPCNDLIMFKLREGTLDMTVSCRSNDAIWGAYGANAVQFSMLQEFVASAVGARVGTYRQVSDSFHIYTDNPTWKSIRDRPLYQADPYYTGEVAPFPIMLGTDHVNWLGALSIFMNNGTLVNYVPFFEQVAVPIRQAWEMYKNVSPALSKNARIYRAVAIVEMCAATDWRRACIEWLMRRREV